MSLWLVSFLGLLQGATELFPVSSLGHAVVVPLLFHLDFNPADTTFVPLLVLLHLGTATALLIIYRDEWRRMIVGSFLARTRRWARTSLARFWPASPPTSAPVS